jgi:hypothetical protein
MTSFKLCTDHMSCFMGPGKPSRFCNYFVEPYLPASRGCFSFWRGNEAPGWWPGWVSLGAKTSPLEKGPRFGLVGTCEWLLHVRLWELHVRRVVRFFSCRVYIDSNCRDTLRNEWPLVCCSHLGVYFVVLLIRGWWLWLCYQDYYYIYLTFDVDLCQCSACLCMF